MTRPDGAHDESGFSLVEVLVAMVIFGILSAVVATSTIQALQSSRKSEARMSANQELTRGAERLTRHLRTAEALREPLSSSQVVFENYVGGVRYLRSYTLVDADDTVTERVAAFASPTSTVPVLPAGRTLLRGIVNGGPVLSYFDDRGQPTTVAAKVARIEVLLQADPVESAPLQVRTSVNLRNAR